MAQDPRDVENIVAGSGGATTLCSYCVQPSPKLKSLDSNVTLWDPLVNRPESTFSGLDQALESLDEALRQYITDLVTQNRELGFFAHAVAHNLQGPIYNIAGYASFLRHVWKTLPEERLQNCLDMIHRQARRTSAIVDEILLLAGLQQGKVDPVPLDMARIVGRAQQRLAPLIQEHKAEIMLPETWPTAWGYGPWIEEVWVNYISNAIKFGGRPPRVQLGTMRTSDSVQFWVRDNGQGLTFEEQGRVFAAHRRLDPVHTEGHGLGLPIARQVVEKLGGQVGVRSQIGRGSVFSFTLPAKGRHAPREKREPDNARESASDDPF